MIYKEIETADKVFGRTRKVSSGTFTDGFELLSINLDTTQVKSSLSGWYDEAEVYHPAEIGVTGTSETWVSAENVNAETTLEHNETNWTETSSADYYVNVYNQEVEVAGVRNDNAELQFTITYGHRTGYGSLNGKKSNKVTQAIYNQYKNVLLGPADPTFTFITSDSNVSVDSDSIYVINFTSRRLKEKYDAGNLEFRLSFNIEVEVDGEIQTTLVSRTFRDDSRHNDGQGITKSLSLDSASGTQPTGRVYNIVKGSLLDETNNSDGWATGEGSGAGQGFGLAYPDLGIIILNPQALASELGSEVETYETSDNAIQKNNIGRKLAWPGDVDPTSETEVDIKRTGTERNHQNFLKLFHAFKLGENFKSRSTELVPSKHYFIRVRNSDFNHSNNPTYVWSTSEASLKSSTGSTTAEYWKGRLRHEDFIDDPRTYITTIGLYNEANELVAVAKLSVPILKSSDTEALIKVKLDF